MPVKIYVYLIEGSAFVPGEVISDPWLVYNGYVKNARSHGAKLLPNSKVDMLEKKTIGSKSVWHMEVNKNHYSAQVIINCGGLWGDDVEKLKSIEKPDIPFIIKPKKGQFLGTVTIKLAFSKLYLFIQFIII